MQSTGQTSTQAESLVPVTAIFALEDLPEKWTSYTKINADYYKKA